MKLNNEKKNLIIEYLTIKLITNNFKPYNIVFIKCFYITINFFIINSVFKIFFRKN